MRRTLRFDELPQPLTCGTSIDRKLICYFQIAGFTAHQTFPTMVPPTRNQHYVPQLLLRGFSEKIKRNHKINVYDFPRAQFRYNQDIKEVASQNYIYDKDNSIENFLQKNIEDPAMRSISLIRDNPDRFLEIDKPLLRFVCAQLARTPGMYRQIDDARSEFFATFAKQIANEQGMTKLDDTDLRLVPNDPSAVLALQTLQGVLSTPLIEDLGFHIAINKTEAEFILSDHPVVLYNWYLRNTQGPRVTAMNIRGMQFFLPVSSEVTLCLYDKNIYAYGSPGRDYSVLSNKEDIDLLNSLQVLSAETFLFYKSTSMDTSIRKLIRNYGNKNLFDARVTQSTPEDIDNGKVKLKNTVWRKQQVLDRMPTFIRVKRKVSKLPTDCSYRQPEVVAAHRLLLHELDKMRASKS